MSQIKRQIELYETKPELSEERRALKSKITPRLTHGGAASRKKRKTPRPYSSGANMLIVLKSSRAEGRWNLAHRSRKNRITAMIYTYANRFKVRVSQARVTSQELHLVVKAAERKALADFLRVLAGRVAVVTTGAKKQVKRVGKFWDDLVWSKILGAGSELYEVHQWFKQEFSFPSLFQNEERVLKPRAPPS